jgi:hypothetical protein
MRIGLSDGLFFPFLSTPVWFLQASSHPAKDTTEAC